MSTSDAASQDAAHEAAPTPAPVVAQTPRFETPIVPQSTIAGRSLVAVVAIMTFLASLTTGAAILVREAASEWQSDVTREVTIQIRPASGRDIEADIATAVAITQGFSGVIEVRPYSREETARLLEPWLGTGIQFDDLPIPRMITVRVERGARLDVQGLRAALAAQVPSATLDDHRSFVERMRAMSGAAMFGGLGIFVLVLTATILSVTFATRAAMASNRTVIEVLHLIGAKNSFIADHFQRHFLELGLKGGAIGGGIAIVLFVLAEVTSRRAGAGDGNEVAALFGIFSLGPWGYVAVIAQVVLIAVVAAVTSRHTVNRTIETAG
jgi:cell division transport system permease protein